MELQFYGASCLEPYHKGARIVIDNLADRRQSISPTTWPCSPARGASGG